jgi:hypothetical protein
MSSNWYYKLMGEVYGPFTASELRKKAMAGEITWDTWIKKNEDGKWVTADRVNGLFVKADILPAEESFPHAPTYAPVKQQLIADNPIEQIPLVVLQRTRVCPFCSEYIQDTAIKCKHCGEFLDGRRLAQPAPIVVHSQSSSGCSQIATIAIGIILAIIILAFL